MTNSKINAKILVQMVEERRIVVHKTTMIVRRWRRIRCRRWLRRGVKVGHWLLQLGLWALMAGALYWLGHEVVHRMPTAHQMAARDAAVCVGNFRVIGIQYWEGVEGDIIVLECLHVEAGRPFHLEVEPCDDQWKLISQLRLGEVLNLYLGEDEVDYVRDTPFRFLEIEKATEE